ncbi:MAG: tetratricopeptide repeat protein [Ardenticatenaceae bacterium]|nr:tetratricopeptide repeat protein [Anaerolineales bacterium]MCB8922508.1 tetratricopeptide repeat protein [Ardenticatenaceae bacterium]MCB8989977.1 tetratricopeptide repeat protein [Ardenticatenaceae bacterium]
MNTNPFHFADVLGKFVSASGYTTGQLAKLTGIPKPTIVNWLEGRVKRPRGYNDLLRLTAVLHLNQSQADQVLIAAGHPPIADLHSLVNDNPELLTLLKPWPIAKNAPAVSSTPFQAMSDLPTFVGRESELDILRHALQADHHPQPYSIQGMSGVGKTTLAAHLAHQLRHHFRDGVLWARLDTSDTLSILSAIARAYGVDVNPYADLHGRSRVVRDILTHKHALIVLDNAQSSEQIEPLLPSGGRCAVLVTTQRQNLAVLRGAMVVKLRPFLSPTTSLALFAQILGPERAAAERPALSELADLLGHLPQAIDIAASRLAYEPGWSTADFLQRVRQRQRRLAELAYENQSIHLSFDASLHTLPPEQRPFLQRFLRQISYFSGEDFSDEAATIAADLPIEKTQDLLRQLYSLSLLQRGRTVPAGQPSRYATHPLLRDYAAQQDEATQPKESAIAQRLAVYFGDYVKQHQHDYAALELEMQNILMALHLAEMHGEWASFTAGVVGFYPFLEARGLYELAGNYLARAETAVTHLQNPALLLQLAHQQGRLAQRRGDYIEAETRYEAALHLARQQKNEAALSHILRALGVLAARRGDYGLADAYYKEGLALARQLGQGGAVSDFLRGLGVQAYMQGELARAEDFYEAGLSLIYADEAESAASADMLWGLGTLAEEQGDFTQAEAYYRQALERATAVSHLERSIVLRRSLGGLALIQGDEAAAEAHFAAALSLAEDIGHRWQVGRALSQWGELKLQRGQLEAAQAAFNRLFDLARVLQSQELVAVAQYGQARVAARSGDKERAADKARQALDGFTAIGHYRVQEVMEWLREE